METCEAKQHNPPHVLLNRARNNGRLVFLDPHQDLSSNPQVSGPEPQQEQAGYKVKGNIGDHFLAEKGPFHCQFSRICPSRALLASVSPKVNKEHLAQMNSRDVFRFSVECNVPFLLKKWTHHLFVLQPLSLTEDFVSLISSIAKMPKCF